MKNKQQLIESVLELQEDNPNLNPYIIDKTIFLINLLPKVYPLTVSLKYQDEVNLLGNCESREINIIITPDNASLYTWDDEGPDTFIRSVNLNDIKTKLEEIYEDTNYGA